MSDNVRLLDLLAARATEGLSPAEDYKLQRLLAEQEEYSADDLELVAAEVDLAFQTLCGDPEPMPEMLRHRVLRSAGDHLQAAGEGRSPVERSRTGLAWAGWVAAAAVLVMMLIQPWGDRSIEVPALTTMEQRADFLDSAPDAITVAWAAPDAQGYAGVTGDVVWSDTLQAGYMRLRGMPRNIPSEAQYQLWIVDPARDKNPVDGGVFDITSVDGEWIVPIDAKLDVFAPKAFAITLEQPGGVVVSGGPLLVVAPVG